MEKKIIYFKLHIRLYSALQIIYNIVFSLSEKKGQVREEGNPE